MKTLKIVSITALVLLLASNISFAQMGRTMDQSATPEDDHTAREEAEGKVVWEKLQAKQATCEELADEDFGALGEYFMGQMMGDAHPAMNQMMTSMMGEEGEEAMHVVMGKRLSGCDPKAAFPTGGAGFMPMMQMMMGGGSTPFGTMNNNMMYGYYGTGGFIGELFMILWWVLIIAGIVALLKWIRGTSRGPSYPGASATEILKERYAKGEIDKKEFEEKLKEIRNA